MQLSPRGPGRSSPLAAAALLAVLATIPSLAAPPDDAPEATQEQVVAKAREVDERMGAAEERLAKSLESANTLDAARRDSEAAAASLADLVRTSAADGRAASRAMQWILDNAPQ
jgi:hypothetical protein